MWFIVYPPTSWKLLEILSEKKDLSQKPLVTRLYNNDRNCLQFKDKWMHSFHAYRGTVEVTCPQIWHKSLPKMELLSDSRNTMALYAQKLNQSFIQFSNFAHWATTAGLIKWHSLCRVSLFGIKSQKCPIEFAVTRFASIRTPFTSKECLNKGFSGQKVRKICILVQVLSTHKTSRWNQNWAGNRPIYLLEIMKIYYKAE